jgi:sugar/nucleoside kinase (ribokinase family)
MATLNNPIICLGIMVADVIGWPMHTLPEKGRLVLVDEMSLHTGGGAINTATALARLGLPVQVVGKIGSDPFGDFLVSALTRRGISTRGVARDPDVGTSSTMVMVDDDGERSFVHYIGANARLTLDDVDLAMLNRASILYVTGALVLPGIDGEPTAELMKQARERGVLTFLDTVWDGTGRWMAVIEPCLPYVDYFVPSLHEARALTGQNEPTDAARALLDHGVGTVGLKMGCDGCLVMTDNGKLIRQPAFKVKPVDATGAGDSFSAGFIAGVWLGLSLERTARLANAVGAMCVTGVGAAGGVSTLDDTLTFMETTPVREG